LTYQLREMGKDRITKKIGFLYWHNRRLFTSMFPHPVGPGQAAFLVHLSQDTEVRQDALVAKIGVDKAIGTRVIRKLSEADYIRRRRDPENHRAYLISLSDKGVAMKSEILEVLDSINSTLFENFTKKERKMTHKLMDRMIANIQQAIPKSPERPAEKNPY
jgi:MarR family transcriptional regulator for hemolysin